MDKGILMSQPNILALLAKRKVRTMRPMKVQPILQPKHKPFKDRGYNVWYYKGCCYAESVLEQILIKDARCQPGDMLYAKEEYQIEALQINPEYGFRGKYLADNKEFLCQLTRTEINKWVNRKHPHRKTPGRFMYKSLSRISMPCTKVTVQRPQDLTWQECIAEGVNTQQASHAEAYWKDLYISIYGKDKWKANLWHFVYWWEEVIVKGE